MLINQVQLADYFQKYRTNQLDNDNDNDHDHDSNHKLGLSRVDWMSLLKMVVYDSA